MKTTRVILAFLLCLAGTMSMAQDSELEYCPFARGGMKFETKVGIFKENTYVCRIGADTVINGETWRKVYNSIPWRGRLDQSYFAAVRDVGRKVYAIAKGSTRPRLLYDFDLEEEDFIRCGMEGSAFGCLLEPDEPRDMLLGFPLDSYLMVERIDTVKFRDGLERRRFTLTLCDYFKYPIAGPIVWIEGLGSSAGPFSPWTTNPQPFSDDPYPSYYTDYSLNSDYIAVSYEFYTAEASSVPTAVSIPRQKPEDNTPFDLQGRKLSAQPAQGIYIEDGKKKVKGSGNARGETR